MQDYLAFYSFFIARLLDFEGLAKLCFRGPSMALHFKKKCNDSCYRYFFSFFKKKNLDFIFLQKHLCFRSDYMEMDQFPMKNSNSNLKSKSKILEEDEEEPILSRTKRQAPYIIFPEILCIIDYDGYR